MNRNRLLTWTMFLAGMLCLCCGVLLAVYPWYYLHRRMAHSPVTPKPAELALTVASMDETLLLAIVLVATGFAALVCAVVLSLLDRKKPSRGMSRRQATDA